MTQAPASWQTFFSGGTFGLLALGAAAAIVQLQIHNIESRMDRVKHDDEKHEEIRVRELDRRLTWDAFNAYQRGNDQQLELIKNRLNYIEQTRPTTGELKAQADALTQRIDKLYNLTQSQEEWIRTRGGVTSR